MKKYFKIILFICMMIGILLLLTMCIRKRPNVPDITPTPVITNSAEATPDITIEIILTPTQSPNITENLDETPTVTASSSVTTPIIKPSATPSPTLTKVPTPKPTAVPTKVPTAKPTATPTKKPTPKPTTKPTVTPNLCAAGHDYVKKSTLPATLTQKSETTYKCSRCGKTYTEYGSVLRPNVGGNFKCGDSLIGHGLPHSWNGAYMEDILKKIQAQPKSSTKFVFGGKISPQISFETAQRAIDEYMYVQVQYSCMWNFNDNEGWVQLGLMYSDWEEDSQQAFKKAEQIVKNLGITHNTTQRDAIAKINDFICTQKSYNYNYERDVRLLASVERSVGVCQNYACEFQLLCLSAGIECFVQTSDSMNHAWNKVVFPDGSYYWVDTCWNDASVKNSKTGKIMDATVENGVPESTIRQLRNKYLLITTEELKKDHTF